VNTAVCAVREGSISGLVLDFPDFGQSRETMQLANVIRSVLLPACDWRLPSVISILAPSTFPAPSAVCLKAM